MKMLKKFLNRYPTLKNILKKLLGFHKLDMVYSYFEEKIIYGYIRNIEDRLKAIEEKLGIANLNGLLEFKSERKPTLSSPVSQPSTHSQFLEPIYQSWCHRIKSKKKFHRKQWEYIFILRCLEIHEQIKEGKKGIGFGVGFEPIAPYLATQKIKTIATDLTLDEAQNKGWVHTNQYTKKLEDLENFGLATGAEIKEFIQYENVDMNAIDQRFMNETFDFTWSACALEHLGSIEKGLEFIINSLNCLKPGGIAVHTTELNVSSNDKTLESGATVLFRKKDFEDLQNRVRALGHEIELNFDIGNSRLDDFYDIPPYSEHTHLKLLLNQFITTSFGICIKKKI